MKANQSTFLSLDISMFYNEYFDWIRYLNSIVYLFIIYLIMFILVQGIESETVYILRIVWNFYLMI